MAWVENIPPRNNDSEMEEGEIVDDLSDISSGEEFLLRQRLQVLENYNNVLERKKAKKSSVGIGVKQKKGDAFVYDLSEISATEMEDYGYTQITVFRNVGQKTVKTHHRPKKKKWEPVSSVPKSKTHKRKTRTKRKIDVKDVIISSDESEDEYRNRRRKLAHAVIGNRDRQTKLSTEKSSLSARLKTMLRTDTQEDVSNEKTSLNERLKDISHPDTKTSVTKDVNETVHVDDDQGKEFTSPKIGEMRSTVTSLNGDDHILNHSISQDKPELKELIKHADLIDLCNDVENKPLNSPDLVDLCTDDDSKPSENIVESHDTVDASAINVISNENVNTKSDKDSDEDLELLRQHALKSKVPKTKTIDPECTSILTKNVSEDEDSDTAELRLICLKSALLKKAIEMKRKQKLQKRLSQSSNLNDDFLANQEDFGIKNVLDNNTDIESVDMEIGSDADEKTNNSESAKVDANENSENIKVIDNNNITELHLPKEDELEEDEDLLRAKLLTSLSKNISRLVSPNVINTIDKSKQIIHVAPKPPDVDNIPLEKRFIINLGESDSEGEHEATKNLTKMHMKLSEQIDFQQKLDTFLKSTRMAVEKTILPDVVQQKSPLNPNEKFVAKAVNHLPKSEQIEYKNLVKRMAELEKIKQARQSTVNMAKLRVPMKDTLKPRNVTINPVNFAPVADLDEHINLSRKKIAEESAKMMRLKEEGTKLSQKYKIVATELKNIKTALALNKKQQMAAQNYLTRIRLDHQKLLRSLKYSMHSKMNGILQPLPSNLTLQKENTPAKGEYKNPIMQKTVKISVVNNVKDTRLPNTRVSVQIDVPSNKNIVTVPEMESNDNGSTDKIDEQQVARHPIVEKGGGIGQEVSSVRKTIDVDDYKSPLDALGSTDWEGDPNAILCPFEVDGDCKDADCKYLHTRSLTQ